MSGLKILPQDVVTVTKLSMPVVTLQLNQIASETGGHMHVTSGGSIAYSFERSLKNIYLLNGVKQFARAVFRFLSDLCFFAVRLYCLVAFLIVRVVFGLILLLSVVPVLVFAIISCIRFLKFGHSESRDKSKDWAAIEGYDPHKKTSNFSLRTFLRYFAVEWIWDWVRWGQYLKWGAEYGIKAATIVPPAESAQPGAGSPSDHSAHSKKAQTDNFLTRCFSFLFGKGDPNVGMDQRYWNTLAQVIQANQGAVTAEQLAPYTGIDRTNEDWMIPTMVRLGGKPEVTESGHIVYVFPKVRSPEVTSPTTQTAVDTSDIDVTQLRSLVISHVSRQQQIIHSSQQRQALQPFLSEKNWTFMDIPKKTIIWICIFATIIFGVSACIIVNQQSIPYVASYVAVFYALLVYSGLFLVLPLARWLIVNRINQGIEKRNKMRGTLAKALSFPSPEIAKKLEEARIMRITGLPQRESTSR
jgi:hypothetical protein